MKVALIQINSNENINENFNKFTSFLKEASENNSELVVFPENTFFIGSMKENNNVAKKIKELFLDKIIKEIKKYKIDVIIGGIPYLYDDNNKPFNRLFYIDKNGIILKTYDKIHLFKLDNSDSISNEPSFVKSGKEIVTLKNDNFIFGFSICYDLRFPELYRKLIDKGSNVLFVPAAFTFKTGSLHWEVLLRARAIENQAYVLAPNQVGFHGKNGKFGHSYGKTSFVTPKGEITSLDTQKEGVLYCEIEKEKIDEFRSFLPALENRVIR